MLNIKSPSGLRLGLGLFYLEREASPDFQAIIFKKCANDTHTLLVAGDGDLLGTITMVNLQLGSSLLREALRIVLPRLLFLSLE